jgi:hypothetical protein
MRVGVSTAGGEGLRAADERQRRAVACYGNCALANICQNTSVFVETDVHVTVHGDKFFTIKTKCANFSNLFLE